MKKILLLVFTMMPTAVFAQTSEIRGEVVDQFTQEPISGANIVVLNTDPLRGASTDLEGRFILENMPAGIYAIQVSFLGYKPKTVTDVVVQTSRPTILLVELSEAPLDLGGVTVEASAFASRSETATSLKTLDAEEVRRTPGGLNDISRSLLSLPGVISGADNRNDLLVRGGGPGENAYFLDGIEIPQINHFPTQGATGGPLGLLNVDFIRETEFLTGGFPARYGDALSSVLSVKNRPGSPDRLAGDLTLGASEAGLTLDGPLGSRGNWLFSARRSYLQFLFELIGLPFLPSYWDFQTKVEYNVDPKNRFTFVGIGAIDNLDFNAPEEDDIANTETLDRLFDNDQWSYTNGLVWRHLYSGGFLNLAVSRSMNEFRFQDEDKESGETIFSNISQESENRIRLDADMKLGKRSTAGYGGGITYAGIDASIFEKSRPGTNVTEDITFENRLFMWKTFAYGQATIRSTGNRLSTTVGLRYDGNSFLDNAHYLSPRLSVSYRLKPGITANAAVGRFRQSPEYLTLAVQDRESNYVNQALDYIRADHYIFGLGWEVRPSLLVSVEGFLKSYSDYPVSIADERISLANLGGDFGFVGAEPLGSFGKGRAYGVEVFAQKKLVERFYGIASYTLSRSEFSGRDGVLKPSSWDVRQTIALTAGYRIDNRWEIGAKWRYLSGFPFTPFDVTRSNAEFALTGRGVPDYDRLNEERMPAYHRLDIRIERRFAFSRWNGVVYTDIQNVYNRTNLFGYSWTQDPAYPDQLRPQEQIGFLPNIGFSIEI